MLRNSNSRPLVESLGLVARSLALSAALSVALSATLGCTKEISSQKPHETSVSEDSKTATTLSGESAGAQVTTADAALFSRKFKVQLSKERLEQSLRTNDMKVREELFSSIEAASGIVASLKHGPERTSILQTFSNAVQSGCNVKLAGCHYLPLFRRQPGTVSLALAVVNENRDPEARLRALSIAFALVGEVDDSRIARAYLQSTPLIESSISELKAESAKVRHQEIVEHSLVQLSKSVATARTKHLPLDAETASLLGELSRSWDLFNFSRSRRPETTARERILFSMVSSQILEPSELLRQIELSQVAEAAVSKKLSRIASPAKKALGLEETIPNDIHLFLFDSLWLDRITAQEADLLWESYVASKTNSVAPDTVHGAVSDAVVTDIRTKAQEALLNYFKTRLLSTSKDVNGIVVDFFNKKEKVVTANAFQDGLEETLKGATLWAEARRRFENLQAFNLRNLRSTNFEVRTTKDLEKFIASLDRNIKVLSTYPSMLVMAYNLARLDFSLKVYTWTGVFEVKAGLILDWFFNGTLSPWMAYSNDRSALSKSEISQVFFYAMEMGVLNESGISIEDLFRMLTEQMVGPLRADIQKVDNSFRSAFDENPVAADFHRLCQAERTTGQAADAAPMISLHDLKNYLISGTPQFGLSGFLHPTFNAAWSFFETEQMGTQNRLDDNLEIIRLEFTPRINHLRSLYRMVNDYVGRHSVVGGGALISSIDQRISELEGLRSKVYSRIFRLVKNTGPCGENAIEHELSSQVHVIEGLMAHFKLVHTEMKALRQRSAQDAVVKKFGFSGRVLMEGLEAHEAGLGISADMYRLSRLQILLRITEILESGFVDGQKVVAPMRNKGSIAVPSRLQDVQSEYRRNPLRLDWTDDADEFVTNGIQQVFDSRSNFLLWTRLNSLALSLKVRIRSMVALAKAGTVDTDIGPQRIDLKEVARITLKTAKWLEVENTVWVNVLNVTGEYTRVEMNAVLNDYAREAGNHNWIGTLDFAFQQLTEDKLGANEGDEGGRQRARFALQMGPLATYAMHSRTMQAMSQPTLTVPPATMSDLTKLYKGSLDRELGLVGEFLEEARRLEALRKERPAMFPSWRIYSSRKSPVVPMLTVSAIERYRSLMLEFGRQTGYVIPSNVETALKTR